MRRLWIPLLLAAGLAGQRAPLAPPCLCGSPAAAERNREGMESHRLRRLDEASSAYRRALDLAPPRDPTPAERELILRFAPRILVTPAEPFALRDAAAVLHPSAPWIAYHFFWEDDIDFPDDNDPCDHELMWVRLDPARIRILDYYTYFHGRLLRAPAGAVENAGNHGGRPAVLVQWGKHGSMPLEWNRLPMVADRGDVERAHMKLDQQIRLEDYNRATWEKLATLGRQSQESPLARGWPLKFPGAWKDFTDFSRPVDPTPLLRRNAYWKVSCWNNAVIDRHFLVYNFAVKTEWPEAVCQDR